MPNEAAKKVYIIDDADTMNASAQNAMLKLLEEPPDSAAFILCAANPELLLVTVRSRCVLLRINADAEEDEGARAAAREMLSALLSGRRSELVRWSVSAGDMDTLSALAMFRAAREGPGRRARRPRGAGRARRALRGAGRALFPLRAVAGR